MTKTIITPENNSILLPVPNEYVGKRLEVLMYAVEELSDSNRKPITMEVFKGILTNEDAALLQQHIKNSREEWDMNI